MAGIKMFPTFAKACIKSLAGLFQMSISFIKKSSLRVRKALKYREMESSGIATPTIPIIIVKISKTNQMMSCSFHLTARQTKKKIKIIWAPSSMYYAAWAMGLFH